MPPLEGQIVLVHYRGTLADGSEFDSSEGREPLQFTVGTGEVIPGFDEAVLDMEIGDKKSLTIPAERAYGDRVDEAVQSFPLESFPQVPEVGWVVELQTPEGQRMAAAILEVTDTEATLDFNHPLAGHDLTFDIELMEIVEDTGEAAE